VVGASSPGELTMGCISEDPTSCSGCVSTAGAATCTNMCAPSEYAVSCGGPPHPPSGGGSLRIPTSASQLRRGRGYACG
jgi:hypothetical protein